MGDRAALTFQVDFFVAECDRWRAECDKLRGALTEIWNELAYMDGDKPDYLCRIAKAALEK